MADHLHSTGDIFLKGYQLFSAVIKRWVSSAAFPFIVLLLTFLAGTFINSIDPFSKINFASKSHTKVPLNCFDGSFTATCPKADYPETFEIQNSSSAIECPEYFRWIHEDLKPWKNKGITRSVVKRGVSHFRLVILNGKAYVKKYAKPFQTRDVFTIWGILQLLRLYPGKVPDLELLFQCGDRTVVDKKRFQGPEAKSPPPMFHYCGQEDAFDIVFPDWTFWGWSETNIKPWETILKAIQESSKEMKWKDRVPYAFWKGNPWVSSIRNELRKCNSSHQHDWNAHIYALDWDKETSHKFKNTKLENQCTHRYKIYVEGATWSVSEKYILACDSMCLLVEPRYYDFFTRSMLPLQHYWPISTKNMCKNIKYAVEWGNNYTHKAEEIGKGGSNYIQENLKMNFVYDYMFHVLQEYAKLLRFKPTIPKGAVEICAETVACPMKGLGKQFLVESLVEAPSKTPPCAMPPPFKPQALHQFLQTKQSLIKQVETRASQYWENLNKKQ